MSPPPGSPSAWRSWPPCSTCRPARAALILCDVLGWPAKEAAAALDGSAASVNSALQRARATLAESNASTLDPVHDDAHQALLQRYVVAFESYDMSALVALLREDVVLSMPPYALWLRGVEDLVGWFVGEGAVCRNGRLIPVSVNGTAGFGNYHFVRPGLWEPWAIQVIEVAGGRIVGHHNFLGAQHFEQFGLPPRIEEPIGTGPTGG
jgi:RNA polymerase sigma-70 factor (ECF subfamily)